MSEGIPGAKKPKRESHPSIGRCETGTMELWLLCFGRNIQRDLGAPDSAASVEITGKYGRPLPNNKWTMRDTDQGLRMIKIQAKDRFERFHTLDQKMWMVVMLPEKRHAGVTALLPQVKE